MSESRAAVSRREIVASGAAAVLGSALTGGSQSSGAASSPRTAGAQLRTRICDLFGISLPIFQAPMARIVTPAMIAAVGNAGGLGILAGAGTSPDDLRRQIAQIRDLTDRPFAVNLILHAAISRPAPPETIPAATLRSVQTVLNRFRERLGIPTAPARAPAFPAFVDEAFEVILAERVPVFSVGVGKPSADMVARCRAQGTKVVSMITTVADAVEVAALGVDAVIAQGSEAGGHRSTWIKRSSLEEAAIGTLALTPQVVDAVRVPVVAAGGICDGRQLAAALALGASGIHVGTRFIATRESAAPEFYKRALIERDSDDTTITDAFTGLYARMLRNTYTEEYRSSGAPVVPGLQQLIGLDIVTASAQRGSGEYYPMYAGQGLGMIRDVPGATDVVRAIVAEAERTLEALASRSREA